MSSMARLNLWEWHPINRARNFHAKALFLFVLSPIIAAKLFLKRPNIRNTNSKKSTCSSPDCEGFSHVGPVPKKTFVISCRHYARNVAKKKGKVCMSYGAAIKYHGKRVKKRVLEFHLNFSSLLSHICYQCFATNTFPLRCTAKDDIYDKIKEL